MTNPLFGGPTVRLFRLGLVAAFVLAALLVSVPGANAATSNASITVLHGLPDFTADVYVNSKLLLDGFKPESVTRAISIPPGIYHLAIRPVGADPHSPPAVSGVLHAVADTHYTAAAHLDASGHNVLTIYKDELSPVPAGKSRLVMRDVADAPPFNIMLDGSPLFSEVSGPQSQLTLVAPRTHSVTAQAADGSQLIAATPLTLRAGDVGFLYVIGSDSASTLDFMFQPVSDLSAAPNNVPAGSGGLAASPATPRWLVGLVLLFGSSAVASLVSLRRRGVKAPARLKG